MIQYLEEIRPGYGLLNCTTEDLQAVLRKFYEEGLSPRSQARMISTLRGFYSYALIEKLISNDPAELLDMPRSSKELPDVLSIEEISTIIESIDLSSVGFSCFSVFQP